MAIGIKNSVPLEDDSINHLKYYINVDSKIEKYFFEAKSRIFNLSAGDRIGLMAPFIMRIGFAKLLYAGNELGIDPESNKSFIIFSPDGTCSYNIERLKRGFSYGALIHSDFNGMLTASNSMPNGCGFSIFSLDDNMSDEQRIKHIEKRQKEMGEEHIYQLGKGNHFAGLYEVRDPISGEDTGERHLIVHCSGHTGTKFLYNPQDWLREEEGFHEISTPHGPVHFLEGEAKKRYIEKSKDGEEYNTNSRREIMTDVFGDNYKIIEEITHQGLTEDGLTHKIGVQIHDGDQPIAFNPEEGIITVKSKNNLSSAVLETQQFFSAKVLGITSKLKNLNFTPHGAGYEFRHPVSDFKITLNKHGVDYVDTTLEISSNSTNGSKKSNVNLHYSSFRDIREHMTYRRKYNVMRNINRYDLIEHINDLWPIKQIYPLVSIPGGTL